YFAAVEYRVLVALAAGLGGLILWATILIGVLTGDSAGMLACLGALSMAAPAAVFARRLGWPLRVAWLVPVVLPALFYSILNSMFVTIRNDGVRWRDTFYPLE